jgi:hypothetical protein
MSRLRRLVLSDRFFFVTSRLMESIKVGSTLRINARRKESGLFWQPRFFDRALRTVGDYCEKVESIHLNPVRAGLVKRAEDWPWSSIHDHTGSAQRPAATPSGLSIDRSMKGDVKRKTSPSTGESKFLVSSSSPCWCPVHSLLTGVLILD